ncbi:MAG: CotH kinase family protein [Acidimicrobiia bacterium]
MHPTFKTPAAIRRLRTVVGAVALTLALAACGTAGAGDADRAAAASSTAAESAGGGSETATGAGLFDDGTVHTVAISYDEADYAELVAAYEGSAEKIWIEATVTIDGVTYEQAAIRLKGNSSLFGLRDSGTGTEAQTLPWLVRLDKEIEGQSHLGVSAFVVRSNSSETALNEALALELLEAAGLASESSASIRLTMNGSAEELRLVVEHLDEAWEEANFAADGLLYKAESEGDYTYRGDDPAAYEDVFDQETGEEDLTPLIEFLDFVNNSDDATFAAELDRYLDVEAFATYLAFEELIDNFDDIDGPGNNSYLRYDAETGRMTVVAWDHNLAFGVRNVNGGGPGGAGGPGGQRPTGQAPVGQAPVGGGFPTGGGPGAMGGPNAKSNPLVERFLADDTFAGLVTRAKADLQAELFDSGLADELLAERAAVLTDEAADLVDAATVAAEVAAITASIAT